MIPENRLTEEAKNELQKIKSKDKNGRQGKFRLYKK